MINLLLLAPALLAWCGSGKICHQGIDLMLLQDTSGSFIDDMPNIRRQLLDLIQRINDMFPESWSGAAEMRDKPFYPLGELDDFCYKLGEGYLSPDPHRTAFAYQVFVPSGGGDDQEDHYQAVVNTILDPRNKWRTVSTHVDPPVFTVTKKSPSFFTRWTSFFLGSSSPLITERIMNPSFRRPKVDSIFDDDNASAEVAARVIIVITDGTPHFRGDMQKYVEGTEYGWNVPKNLPPNSAAIVNNDTTYSCLNEDYMTPDQFKKVVQDYGIQLLVLTTADSLAPWRWVNDQLLANPPEYLQVIDSQSMNMTQGIISSLTAVATRFCPDPITTSTVAPPENCNGTDCGCCGNQCAAGGRKKLGVALRVKDKPKMFKLEIQS